MQGERDGRERLGREGVERERETKIERLGKWERTIRRGGGEVYMGEGRR